jgi:hypothetical protein
VLSDADHQSYGYWGRKTYGISASGRQSVNLQHGIVRRHLLKSDISMPAVACEFPWFCQLVHRSSSSFLLLHTADHADLIAKLATGFSEWMNMKTR